jgi:hypothetical protein
VLAEKLGLDKQKLFDISSKSSGQCWSMTNYCPVPGPVPTSPANRDYQAGFTAAMMLKDLALAQDAANAAGRRDAARRGGLRALPSLRGAGVRLRKIFPASSTSCAASSVIPKRSDRFSDRITGGKTPTTQSVRELSVNQPLRCRAFCAIRVSRWYTRLPARCLW